jgi:hypothetical protein
MPSGRRLKKSCRFVKSLGAGEIEAGVPHPTTASVSRGYSGFSGQALPGVHSLSDTAQKVLSTGGLSNGQRMEYWKNSGELSWPSWRRMTTFVGTNASWTGHSPQLKKGVLRRKNQTRQGNEAYGTG